MDSASDSSSAHSAPQKFTELHRMMNPNEQINAINANTKYADGRLNSMNMFLNSMEMRLK